MSVSQFCSELIYRYLSQLIHRLCSEDLPVTISWVCQQHHYDLLTVHEDQTNTFEQPWPQSLTCSLRMIVLPPRLPMMMKVIRISSRVEGSLIHHMYKYRYNISFRSRPWPALWSIKCMHCIHVRTTCRMTCMSACIQWWYVLGVQMYLRGHPCGLLQR